MKKQKSLRKNNRIRRNKNKTRKGGVGKKSSTRIASSTIDDNYIIPKTKPSSSSSNRRSFSERLGKMCNTASCRSTRNDVIPHSNQENDISEIYNNTNTSDDIFTGNNPLKLKKPVPPLNLANSNINNNRDISRLINPNISNVLQTNNNKPKSQMQILKEQLEEKKNPYTLPPQQIQRKIYNPYESSEGAPKNVIDRLTEKLNAQENVIKQNQQEIIKSQQNKVIGKIKISDDNKQKFEELLLKKKHYQDKKKSEKLFKPRENSSKTIKRKLIRNKVRKEINNVLIFVNTIQYHYYLLLNYYYELLYYYFSLYILNIHILINIDITTTMENKNTYLSEIHTIIEYIKITYNDLLNRLENTKDIDENTKLKLTEKINIKKENILFTCQLLNDYSSGIYKQNNEGKNVLSLLSKEDLILFTRNITGIIFKMNNNAEEKKMFLDFLSSENVIDEKKMAYLILILQKDLCNNMNKVHTNVKKGYLYNIRDENIIVKVNNLDELKKRIMQNMNNGYKYMVKMQEYYDSKPEMENLKKEVETIYIYQKYMGELSDSNKSLEITKKIKHYKDIIKSESQENKKQIYDELNTIESFTWIQMRNIYNQNIILKYNINISFSDNLKDNKPDLKNFFRIGYFVFHNFIYAFTNLTFDEDKDDKDNIKDFFNERIIQFLNIGYFYYSIYYKEKSELISLIDINTDKILLKQNRNPSEEDIIIAFFCFAFIHYSISSNHLFYYDLHTSFTEVLNQYIFISIFEQKKYTIKDIDYFIKKHKIAERLGQLDSVFALKPDIIYPIISSIKGG